MTHINLIPLQSRSSGVDLDKNSLFALGMQVVGTPENATKTAVDATEAYQHDLFALGMQVIGTREAADRPVAEAADAAEHDLHVYYMQRANFERAMAMHESKESLLVAFGM